VVEQYDTLTRLLRCFAAAYRFMTSKQQHHPNQQLDTPLLFYLDLLNNNFTLLNLDLNRDDLSQERGY